MLSSNQVLNQGRYRVINHFGNSESGSLYEAYDTFSETRVVLRETVGHLGKVATAAQIENLKLAFAADAKRLTETEHPSLLKVRDYFSEIDRQYLVMEDCEGTDLAELVGKSEKNLALSDILRWADQLLDGLGYLQSKSPAIIHQNVNPQNIRLTSNFTIKLLVTASNHASEQENSESSESVDQPYRSLEQLWRGLDLASQQMIANSFGERSEEVLRQSPDARTDVYSAAATIYFLLTRTVPADALNRYLEVLDGNDDPLQKPTDIDPSIPAEVSDVLIKAMEMKREYRYENAATLRGELAKIKVQLNSRLAETKNAEAPAADTRKEDEARLKEERLRVENERMELEAEERQLEEERVKIEKRRLELNAERKRQADAVEASRKAEENKKEEALSAEKAAGERKAAAEKKAAELKATAGQKAAADKKAAELKAAAEQKAAAEKKAAEQKAIAEKKVAENKAAAAKEQEARLKLKAETQEKAKLATPENHEVENLQADLAKDDLLDLPEHISEPAALTETAGDVFALDVESPASSSAASYDTSFDLYPDSDHKRSFLAQPLVLGAGAVVVLLLVAGIWMFSGKAPSTASPAATIQSISNSSVQTEEPVNFTTSEATPSTETPAVEQSPTDTPGVTADVKARNEQLAKQKQKQEAEKKAKPTPEKKKVTVDDLINDN
ncbi:MAG: protein kinase [Acidobacteriota bacterium]